MSAFLYLGSLLDTEVMICLTKFSLSAQFNSWNTLNFGDGPISLSAIPILCVERLLYICMYNDQIYLCDTIH